MKTFKWTFKSFSFALGLLVLLFVVSCNKDNMDYGSNYEIENNIKSELDQGSFKGQSDNTDYYLNMVSKVYAVAQQNSDFRALILREAQKEQGGDNVVFYAGIRNQRIGKTTVQELFSETASNIGLEVSKDFFGNGLVSTLPRLSFSVYTGSDAQEIKAFSYDQGFPVVAETKAFAGEKAVSAIAYDDKLNETSISNTEDPSHAVIVVENNTSFILINKEITESDIKSIMTVTGVTDICDEMLLLIHTLIVDLGELSPSDPLYDLQLLSITQFMNLYLEICGGGPGNQEPTCTDGIQNGDETGIDCGGTYCEPCEPGVVECDDNCERTALDEREWITEIKVDHGELKKFCKWWKKYCSIQVDVVYGIPEGQTAVLETLPTKYINGKRKHMKKGKVFGANLPLYKWHWCEGEHSDIYAVNFVGRHHNPGTVTTLNFGLPDFKIKILGQEVSISSIFNASVVFTAADNPLGGDAIYYCDDIVDEDADNDGDDDGKKYTSGSIDFWITETP